MINESSVVCKAWLSIVSDGSFLRRYRRFHGTPPLLGYIWNHKKLVQEILLRIPPDEPAHLVYASLVCKSWHSIVSNGSFLRRYRRFHGTPPLLGYIYNHYDNGLTRFVPKTFVATPPVRTRVLDYSGRTPTALDCRHGRVLSEAKDCRGLVGSLIVWDPITGGQQNLSMPSYLQYVHHLVHVGAVLCAKDGCDHLDCHNGPFLVVIVGTSYVGGNDVVGTWASVYSSETGAWIAPTPNIIHQYVDDRRPSLLIGDALYFTTVQGKCVVKYDLRKHGLSVIGNLPGQFWPMLMKGDDGGLGVAALLRSCIHMWSWRAGINGIDEWVKYRVMELDTQIPKGGRPRGLICMAEGTNTIFIGIDTEIIMIDLKSGQVRKIGQRDRCYHWRILPYMSFYTPKY